MCTDKHWPKEQTRVYLCNKLLTVNTAWKRGTWLLYDILQSWRFGIKCISLCLQSEGRTMQIKSQRKLKVLCNWHFNYLVWILFILFIPLNANNSGPLYKYYLHWKSSVPLIKTYNCLATKSNETYSKHTVFIITMYFCVTHKRLWKEGTV